MMKTCFQKGLVSTCVDLPDESARSEQARGRPTGIPPDESARSACLDRTVVGRSFPRRFLAHWAAFCWVRASLRNLERNTYWGFTNRESKEP